MNVADEIKQKLDIADIVGQYTKLQKSGRNFKATCPFHSEKTPSFFVFPDKQTWHCFGACGTGGDIFTFVMKKEGLDFGQALRLLAEKANVRLEYKSAQSVKEEVQQHDHLFKLNEVAAEYFHYHLQHAADAESARVYAKKRGLSDKIIADFQIGYALNKWDGLISHLLKAEFKEEEMLSAGLIVPRDSGGYYDRFRNRLVYPIKDIKSRVIGFGGRALDDSLPKYLNSPQTVLFDKSSVLYAIDRAQAAIRLKDSVVITEGYMDTIAAHQFGFENTIASMGTALTGKQIAILRRLSKNIIVALDADAAGLEATTRSIATIDEQIPKDHWMPWTESKTYEELVKYEIQVVEISGGKDPDEIIRKSPEIWAGLLKESQPIIDFTLKKEIATITQDNVKDKSAIVSKFLPILIQIDDQVRRAHYVQKLSTLLKLDERFVRDAMFSLQAQDKKSRHPSARKIVKNVADKSTASRVIEEYCLALLLQFPDLQEAGMKLSADYFEHSENKDILFKWLENHDAESIITSLDPAMHEYFDYLRLSHRPFPPSLVQSKRERQMAMSDCVNRLQEIHVKNLELIKKSILSEEKDPGNEEQQLEKLKEQGIDGSQQLKDIFNKRGRFFSRTKGV
jgi:DNA primase